MGTITLLTTKVEAVCVYVTSALTHPTMRYNNAEYHNLMDIRSYDTISLFTQLCLVCTGTVSASSSVRHVITVSHYRQGSNCQYINK
jgi:hypothetical protein